MARRVGEIPLQNVVAGDISADGSRVVLRLALQEVRDSFYRLMKYYTL